MFNLGLAQESIYGLIPTQISRFMGVVPRTVSRISHRLVSMCMFMTSVNKKPQKLEQKTKEICLEHPWPCEDPLLDATGNANFIISEQEKER